MTSAGNPLKFLGTLPLLAACLISFNACAVQAEHIAGHSQTVIRTTTENDITIAVESNDNSKNKPSDNQVSPSIEQKGLFRIYRSNLLKKTYQHVIYPETAIDKNQQGDVTLKVVVKRSGKVQSVKFESRSTFNSLNKAATRAVKNASPYPEAPEKLQGDIFEILMPIKFRLAD
jgi:TonB family protein